MAYYDDEPQFISLMDMIDGGGAGRSGDRFEGGGLLSILANALARPRGYEDRLRDRKNDTTDAITDVISELTEGRRSSARQSEFERQLGLEQDLLDPRGNNQMRPMLGEMLGPEISPDYYDQRGNQMPFRDMQPSMNTLTAESSISDYPDMSMQPMAGVTTPPNMESAEQLNLIDMLYDDEMMRKQRGLGLGELTGYEKAKQIVLEQAPMLLENKTPREQFDLIMLMKESRGL